MAKSVKILAFEGGQLRVAAPGSGGDEAVLALPVSRLILKVLRVPAGEDPVAFATPLLQAMSPYPDEPLTVSCEKLRDGELSSVVLAAALPESAADDIGAALDALKVNVVRVDALVLGELRSLFGRLDVSDGARRLVQLKTRDGIALMVLDGDMPCAFRSVADESELNRATMLSLLEAEDLNGSKDLKETLVLEPADAKLDGIARRSREAGTLNALPDSWGEMLDETRFKARLTHNVIVAMAIWLLALGGLFGGPFVYGYLTDQVKADCKAHAKRYREVADMKAKVELVRQYSDHSRGALEMMKHISDRCPAGITLSSWEFSRTDGIRIKGDSASSGDAYKFKDAIVSMKAFTTVELGALSSQKDGHQKFELFCGNEEAEQ